MGIIGWLIFGGLAGWIASKIMGTDAQMGILLNIIVGIVGAFLGGFLYSNFTGNTATFGLFDIGAWLTAIIGSCLLLFLVGLFMGRRRAR